MVDLPDSTSQELVRFPPERFVNATRIGSGSHATVWRAWDQHLEREVACKATLDESAGFDAQTREVIAQADVPSSLRRLLGDAEIVERRYSPLREARLLALVDHPNVVPVLDIGVLDDGMTAVIMPHLAGGGLDARKWTGPWQDLLDVALQIGRGLAAIHAAGMLHRDLKPNNILFDGEGRARIADLGLSCLIDDLDAMGDWVGTRDYQSPEVLAERFRDVRDDIYAYCMIVYQMFYGQPPFATAEDREAGRVAKPTREGGMPRGLHAILVRGLACDADRRWPNMPTLLRAIERTRQPARRRWALTSVALAAAFAVGVISSARVVQAGSCEDVTTELAPIWDSETQAELRGAFGTRKPGDGLQEWANRWVAVRAQECETAKLEDRETGPSPCSASLRQRFDATLDAFLTPHLRRGLDAATVIAELPAPEDCIDHADDETSGFGGLLELRQIDMQVGSVVGLGDLEVARTKQDEYMTLALELQSEYGITRATYWRGEIRRLSGELDDATWDFERVYVRAQDLGVPVVGAEAMMKLTAIAGARGEVRLADRCAFVARATFAAHEPARVAELLQTHGLALLSGPEPTRARAVELLQRAVELREEQAREHSSARELLSQAYESYAVGLLAVHRASEALEYLEFALQVHQDGQGYATQRTRMMLMLKFTVLVELGRLPEANFPYQAVLAIDRDAENWPRYVEDSFKLAQVLDQAGYTRDATLPLREGRESAIAHGLIDDVVRFDLALETLAGK